MKNILYSILLLLFIFCAAPNFAAAQNLPACVPQKTTTIPLTGEYGGFGRFAVIRLSITNIGLNTPVSVFVPSNATAQTRVPVIFFAHGFGGTDYRFYEKLLLQLASNGYIVVFSPYSSGFFDTHATRYNQLFNGFLAAVQQLGNIMDTSRIGFAGHSYGAGATPEMARRAVAQGWGANGLFMFVMAAWYNWGTNMEQIPATAKMIVQVYWDDETNQHLISQNDVWNKLPQINERKWQVIRASRTNCLLNAGHGVPVTDGLGQTSAATDGYDYWGVWRRLHALSDYTFTGNQTAKSVAFGADSFMGRWRGVFGNRQISPLEATDSPVVNSQSNPDFVWSQKCVYALGSTCP